LRFAKFAPIKAETLPGSIRQHVNAILSVFFATIGLIYMSPFKDPAAIIGQAAVVFCIALFGSPLAALKTVLKTKSAKSIPLPFTLATIANCFLWSITGLFEMHDKNIYFRTCYKRKGEKICASPLTISIVAIFYSQSYWTFVWFGSNDPQIRFW
jgi:uncharacterized protein with PQ loop repeat